jgi:Zn-dependent protease
VVVGVTRTTTDRARDLARTVRDRVAAVDERLPWWAHVRPLELRLRSRQGVDTLDAAGPGWDRWHDLGVLAVLAVQAALVPVLAVAAGRALGRSRPTPVNDPANVLAVPGVNEFLPLAAAGYVLVGLVLATAVHEGAHAVACRRAGVAVEEYGVACLLWVLPVAAYVRPGDGLEDAPPRTRARVFAAGILANLALAAVAALVLLAPATGGPETAASVYFGWALVGTAPPTAGAVAALGPATNLAFWTALLSANLAATNALPVGALDGGRVLDAVLEALSPSIRTAPAVRATGVLTVSAVAVTLVAPHVL